MLAGMLSSAGRPFSDAAVKIHENGRIQLRCFSRRGVNILRHLFSYRKRVQELLRARAGAGMRGMRHAALTTTPNGARTDSLGQTFGLQRSRDVANRRESRTVCCLDEAHTDRDDGAKATVRVLECAAHVASTPGPASPRGLPLPPCGRRVDCVCFSVAVFTLLSVGGVRDVFARIGD